MELYYNNKCLCGGKKGRYLQHYNTNSNVIVIVTVAGIYVTSAVVQLIRGGQNDPVIPISILTSCILIPILIHVAPMIAMGRRNFC